MPTSWLQDMYVGKDFLLMFKYYNQVIHKNDVQ